MRAATSLIQCGEQHGWIMAIPYRRFLLRFFIAPALLLLGGLSSAFAHPHVWVVVKSELVFAADGRVSAIRHSWTFDELYSAFAMQGLGRESAALQKGLNELAQVNVKQLAESHYFTFVRAGGKRLEFAAARDARMSVDERKLATLHFTVVLKEPASAGKAFVLQVFDPDYFVAFDFEKGESVTMKGAPQGCAVRMVTPKPLSDVETRRLQEVAGTNDSPGVNFGMKLASRAFLACP